MNNKQTNKVVIIGGVAGGASAAARLRRLDEKANIVLLERGDYVSYANCGLPYYVGGVIEERGELLLHTPESLRLRYNIDVRVGQEATAINREHKRVTVQPTDGSPAYEEDYDTLVIATGSSPLKPPIPGIDHARIQTLWTVPDTDRIHKLANDPAIKRVTVVGGGFIGLEMAENLRHKGLDVTLVEALPQVMAPLDLEMAAMLHTEIRNNGVELLLGDAVSRFEDNNGGVRTVLKSERAVESDLVILAIGVRPNSQLAKDAGLKLNERGGIQVDAHMRTDDPAIYAVGDAVEVVDFVSGEAAMVPLAGPANKQGRIAADNIAGLNSVYNGTQGSSVVQVFGLTAASTGQAEKALIRRGLKAGEDYDSVIVTQLNHAGYYPGADYLTIKLLFTTDGQKVLGAQAVGVQGVDKRIDVIATAIRLGATVQDLQELELCYAPPFSSAKDPMNMAGFMAGNMLAGGMRFAPWDVLEKEPGVNTLDVRDPDEVAAYALPGAKHIPLWQLRERLDELNPKQPLVVFCAVGARAYNAARLLSAHGFEDVRVYPGGLHFYLSIYPVTA